MILAVWSRSWQQGAWAHTGAPPAAPDGWHVLTAWRIVEVSRWGVAAVRVACQAAEA